MASLAVATTLPELKQLYRRYASKFHPDKGGSHQRMQILNKQYRIMKQRIKQAANDPSHSQYNPNPSFDQLKVGGQALRQQHPLRSDCYQQPLFSSSGHRQKSSGSV